VIERFIVIEGRDFKICQTPSLKNPAKIVNYPLFCLLLAQRFFLKVESKLREKMIYEICQVLEGVIRTGDAEVL
jgi:hypothetical protein